MRAAGGVAGYSGVRGIVVGLMLAAVACGDSGDPGVDPQADAGPAASSDSVDSTRSDPGADSAAVGDGNAPDPVDVDDSAPSDDPALPRVVVGLVDGYMGYVGYVAPLTEQLASDSAAAQRRALVVKVGNNSQQSRPQAGLASADVVFESLIEGVRTRFVAVYHSEVPARIGPVRSVRTSDLDLLSDLSEPYFVSSGGNSKVLGQLSSAAHKGILIDGGAGRSRSYYERDESRRAPYNLYFGYTESAESGAPTLLISGDDGSSPVQALFKYGSRDAAVVGESDAVGVSVAYPGASAASAVHVWDSAVQGWVRIQDGTLHITETDTGVAEIAPANVVVLWAQYKRSSADVSSPHALSYGTGEAWLLTGGAVLEAVWERTEDRVGFRFSDSDGRPLTLTPGRTWVLLANRRGPYSVAEVETVSADDGERLLAEARAAFTEAAG